MKKINDVFNNCGLPQYTHKALNDFTKEDVKKIINTIKDNDNYYRSNWIDNNDRKVLVNFVNNLSIIYRWYSLIIR